MQFIILALALSAPADIVGEEVRYVIVDNADEAKMTSFVINSISTNPIITVPKVANGMAVICLNDYNIDPKAWDKIYGPKPVGFPIFLTKAFGKYYRDFLKIQDMKDINKLSGFNDDSEKLKSEVPLVASKVVRGVRMVTRYPTLNGYMWFASSHEIEQYTFSLPNRLQGYAIIEMGVMADEVPPIVAVDHLDPAKGNYISLAKSCIRCHNEGIKGFDFSPLNTINFPLYIERDKKYYSEAVQKATGMNAIALSEKLKKAMR